MPPSQPQGPQQRERERRWTVMLVPHGSEAPRSWSVSERFLRGAAWGIGALAFVLAVGLVTIGVQLRRMASQPAMAATPSASPTDSTVGDVEALRARVEALNQTLDTIRSADARLRAAAGGNSSPTGDSVAMMLSVRAESLQARALHVARRYGSLADSAVRATPTRGRPTKQ